MPRINEAFLNLRASYLFAEVKRRTQAHRDAHPGTRLIDQYMDNARTLREGLEGAGFTVYGGRNAPYIWIRTPGGASSWDFFDRLLAEAQVVGVPGSGFGPSGEGYFRVTAFGSRADSIEAIERIAARFRG